MRITCQHKILFWAALAVSFIKCESVCSGPEEGAISVFDSQILQMEDLWNAGKPREYYLRAADIANAVIAKSAENELAQVVVRLFRNLISKETKIDEAGVNDILVLQKLASYLVSDNNASIEQRRVNVELLSEYLGKVRKEIVPDFIPRPVVANVAQPLGTPGAAGMSPEAIKDPTARAEYERSIRQNRENNLLNSRQSALRHVQERMSRPIVEYIIRTFRADGSSSDLLHRCMSKAMLTESERREAISKIAGKQ